MLSTKYCDKKINAINRTIHEFKDSEIPHMQEYLEHLKRLRTAYQKEYWQAQMRIIGKEWWE